MTPRYPFLIDADPWCDDALAIMFAINSGLDVTTITTVSGNVDEGLVYDNARWILDFMNPASAIRLCRWADRPLVREPFFAKSHGMGGLWDVEVRRGPSGRVGGAVDAIIAFANANEGWKIIALWPLTNIALAIRKDPASMSRIGELIIMGGTIDAPGNVWPVSEFNFYVDPEAAKEVFEFPIPKTLIPIDVCNQAVVPLADLRSLRWANADAIRKIAIPYGDNVDGEERLGWAVMYDPVAAYYAFDASKFEVRIMDISIETEGVLTRGMCVVERRKSVKRLPNVSVVVRVDSDSFKRDFLRALEF